MDQLVQCPVCTLFLHNGMSLESHLDTHPKDQVIKALCNLSANNVGFGSRTSTPMHSERSYRSRSRTPAEDSPRWSGRSIDNERYWRRTPSRCSKTPVSNITRNATPSDVRMGDINFENNSNNATSSPYPGIPFMKSDKSTQNFIQNVPMPEFEQQYVYYPEQQEDKEIKFSRSAEYSAIDNTNNVFTYNMPSVTPGVKLQSSMMPTGSRRSNDLVKLLPKPNNILVKANMGGVQYITPGVKPVHLMVPTAPTFVQKNVQNNMIVSGSIPTSQILEPKSIASPIVSSNSQFSQLSSGTFTPGTTVVTQNSQIIYREMVHNIDGKPFISSMPTVLSGHDNLTNVAGSSSMYQNVMVVDQFGNTSCMYTTPQQILSKPCNTPIYSDVSMSTLEKSLSSSIANEANKTLIIEVSPIVTPAPAEPASTTVTSQASQTVSDVPATPAPEKMIERNDTPGGPTKGLKILSNIKVEVPVQHHKNLLNTVVDLTGPHEPEYTERVASPERILPDFEDNNRSLSGDCMQPSAASNDSIVSNTFSVIKNVGNPPSYKDSVSKTCIVDNNKIDNEFSDSCPMPDLICNEKPSISPCSELSESGDNSTDRALSPAPCPAACPAECSTACSTVCPAVCPKPEAPPPDEDTRHADTRDTRGPPPKHSFRSAPLRLNNIFVKKHKKILEIKNSKSSSATTPGGSEPAPGPSEPARPEGFGPGQQDRTEPLHTVTVELCVEADERAEFDADTEERSMDIEPMPHSSRYEALLPVKEEAPGAAPGPLRPINVISYGSMAADEFDDESEHRELLELEAAAKGKPFGLLGSPAGYFNDGYEYFPRPEFVLPTFVHEQYGAGAGAAQAQYAELAPPDTKPQPPELRPPDHQPDMESPWTGMYTEVSTAESYDLLARESWVSDGEEHDAADKHDVRVEAGSRAATCGTCRARFPSRAALRAHRALAHAQPSYSRLVGARAIKKEDKEEVSQPPASDGGLLLPDSKESLASTMLPFEGVDAKPALDAIVKTEPRRRRRDFTCPTCKQDQGSEPAFHRHLKLHPLECLTCGKCFFRRANLALHIKTHLGIKNFKCEVCEKRFLTRQKLMEHHNTHTGRAPFKCTVCDDTFRRYSNMVQHRDRHHLNKKSKVRDFVCQCGAVFHSRAKLRWHRETHDDKPKACLYCSDKFVHAASLTRHVRRAHNQYYTDPAHNKQDNVPCPVCKQVPKACLYCSDKFVHAASLTRHVRRAHNQYYTDPAHNKQDNVPCPVCKQVHKACLYCSDKFVHAASLTRHVRRAHNQYYTDPAHNKQDNVPCPVCKQVHKACLYCSDKFVHAASLTRHVRRAHNQYYTDPAHNKQDNVPCPVCKQVHKACLYCSDGTVCMYNAATVLQVYLRPNLRAHLLTHSGKRPFVCVVCNKGFTTKWNLKLHRWTHATRSAKPYKCAQCKGAFVRHSEYVAHMNAHKAVRPYTCNYCGCQFIRKYNCQRHVREHEAAKRYVCKVPECGKSFHRSYYLSEHMKVHSGARPFACGICGKLSGNKSNHNKHVKIHHAREPVASEA